MITYNNIIERFEKFVADHLLLRSFSSGSPSGVDLDKFELYPTMHVVYTGSNYESTSKEYSFEIYILDLPPDKADKIDNQRQLVSNAEQVAEDILADMKNGDNVFDFGHLYTVTNAFTTPLEETTSNSLAGVMLTISIMVGYEYDSCNAPLIGVEAGGSEIPSGGGGTISTIHYTTSKATNFAVGATGVDLPVINDGVWLTGDINLAKSISFIINPLAKRHEIHGLNSSATISGEFVFKVSVDSPGTVGISLVTSGAAFTGSASHTFTVDSSVELIISGSTTNLNATYSFIGATILSDTTGTVTVSSVQLTINNQF